MGQVTSYLIRVCSWGYWFPPSTPAITSYSSYRISSLTPEQTKSLFQFPYRVENKDLSRTYQCNVLSKYTVLDPDDPLKSIIQCILFRSEENGNHAIFTEGESRAIGCMFGMVIGDALGAPLEFSPLCYDDILITGFERSEFFEFPYNKFELKPGQWTDDSSMGLCLAESLLVCDEFNPIDLRVRFLNWWDFGYRNAFGDELRSSVGLGGCIGMSFSEFQKMKSEYTTAGDPFTSGNGSIMRLAAVPIFYHDNMELGMDIASKQSKTTHQGYEAAECCRLMSHIIISFINANSELSFEQRKECILGNLKNTFTSSLYSVQCLANSMNEEAHESNEQLDLNDRQWNWQAEPFHYAESRAKQQPGYIGSYCMDGLAMSLHCVWVTNSFEEALLKAINLCGDADTVGSITGQIAGSLYGVESIPSDWIKTIQKWDNEGDIALTALKLFRNEKVTFTPTSQ